MNNLLTVLAASTALCVSLPASFVLVDNFDSYATGDLTNTANWTGAAGAVAVTDIGGNQAAEILTGQPTGFVNSVTTLATPADSVTTVFFQMQLPFYSNARGISSANNVQLRDASLSASFGNNRTQLSLQQTDAGETGTDPILAYRDGSSPVEGPSIDTDVWYNFWMVTDVADQSWSLYQTTGLESATAADLIASGLGWRNTTNSGEVLFSIASAAINTVDQGAYIDNIYFDGMAANLTNPIPEPSTLILITVAGFLSLVWLRRRR